MLQSDRMYIAARTQVSCRKAPKTPKKQRMHSIPVAYHAIVTMETARTGWYHPVNHLGLLVLQTDRLTPLCNPKITLRPNPVPHGSISSSHARLLYPAGSDSILSRW
jgi:hypothetical protein